MIPVLLSFVGIPDISETTYSYETLGMLLNFSEPDSSPVK